LFNLQLQNIFFVHLTIEFSGGKGLRGKTVWDEAIAPGFKSWDQSVASRQL
jgi:hypothetical protein